MIKLKLFQDSRDKHAFEYFGQTTDFEPTISFDDLKIPEKIQPVGDISCTLYSTLYVATNQTKIEYDMEDLKKRIQFDQHGAKPNDVLGEIIKVGLLPIGATERVRPFSSYWRADTGNFDAFDNCRSAMKQCKGPIVIWTSWYQEWLNIGPNAIMPIGKNEVSAHMYACKGWVTDIVVINGQPMFVIEWWGGYTTLMPRETFNEAIGKLGCGTAVLSTVEIDEKRKINILLKIWDLLVNFILSQGQKPVVDITPPIITPDLPIEQKPMYKNIYDTAMSLKGKYLTLDTSVPKTLNCAETISYILKECGYAMPQKGYQGTRQIDIWLQGNFTQIDTPEFGCIINAITEGDNHGHVAINGHQAILSNDSQTGTLQSYWSLHAFQDFYGKQKGLKIKYYRP